MLRSAAAATAAIALSLIIVPSASAQIFYEPVQYQYTNPGGFTYYYGGDRPIQHAYAHHVACRNGYPSDITFPGFSGLYKTIGQIGNGPVVLTDCMPLRNAAVYGYRIEDARNEAYANVPRYFRKSNLLAAARPAGDGTLVIPAQLNPGGELYDAPVEVKPAEVKPRAIIIIPKRAPRKTDDENAVKKVVAVAR